MTGKKRWKRKGQVPWGQEHGRLQAQILERALRDGNDPTLVSREKVSVPSKERAPRALPWPRGLHTPRLMLGS